MPGCDVVLFGDEIGVADVARELGVRHVAQLRVNQHGTPLVSDAFARAGEMSSNRYLGYANADIILTAKFATAATTVAGMSLQPFLMVGRRTDLDVSETLDFDSDWERELEYRVRKFGSLHGMAGLDYFLFPRDIPIKLPDFAVGRPGWDSWLIYQARKAGIPVIDATEAVLAIHQNHPPAYKSYGPESEENTLLAGGYLCMSTLRDADWRLSRRNGYLEVRRRLLGQIMFLGPVRGLLALKRYMARRWSN